MVSRLPRAPISTLRRILSGGSESPSAASEAPDLLSTIMLTCADLTVFIASRDLLRRSMAGPPAAVPDPPAPPDPVSAAVVGEGGAGVSVGGAVVAVGGSGVAVG